MEKNRKTDLEVKELDLDMMEQVSGGSDTVVEYKYCTLCQKETRWENGLCTELIHRRKLAGPSFMG